MRLLAAERGEVVLGRAAGEHVAVGQVRPSRRPRRPGARPRTGSRSRAGSSRSASGRRSGWPSRRGEVAVRARDEAAVGQRPRPVAEHAGRKRAAADDEPRVRRRVGELRLDDRVRASGSRARRCRPSARSPAPRRRALDAPRDRGRASSRATRSGGRRGRCGPTPRRRGSARRARPRPPRRTRAPRAARELRQETSGSVRVKPPLRLASSVRAISKIASAGSESGSTRTSGSPESADSRRRASSGTEPRNGVSSCAREPLAAARAEDLRRHVLDHAEQLHAGLQRHLGRATRDLLRERLRRRHDDRLGARKQLAERDRDVAGPRRHVDDEHVELAPVDVLEELLERLVQHRPAPHHRLVVVEEEADRHQLQVVLDRRDHHPVDEHRLLVDAEHVRDRVAVDVGVEDPDLAPERRRAPPRG